jgi:hypothetical protein
MARSCRSIAVLVRESDGKRSHAGRRVHGEVVTHQRHRVERAHAFGVDAHHHVEFVALELPEQLASGCHGETHVELGVRSAETSHRVAAVVHGDDVDHPDPQPAHPAATHGVQPTGRLPEVRQHPLGECRNGGRVLVRHAPSAIEGEQGHPEPAFQLGDAL